MLINRPKFACLSVIVILLVTIVVLFLLNGIDQPQPIELERMEEWEQAPSMHLQPLQTNYQNKLFNLNFEYVTVPNNCTEELLAVFIVTSYYGNVETRSAMRRAFTSSDLRKMGLKRVFLLGEAPTDTSTTQSSILDESRRFSDIIQGNFIEAYRNLTYKHIMGLKWASENCTTAKYVIKMDDDIVVDIPKILEVLRNLALPPNLVAGYILKKMAPIREPANKWYVTKDEYSYPKYPSFVSGWFYVTTPRIAAKFVLLSHYVDYFWIDDVYVTGILARNLKIKHYDLGRYFAVYAELMQNCLRDLKQNFGCDYAIGPNGGDNNMFFTFNEEAKRCLSQKCSKRVKPLNHSKILNFASSTAELGKAFFL